MHSELSLYAYWYGTLLVAVIVASVIRGRA